MIIWKSTDLEAEMEIEKQNWDQKGSLMIRVGLPSAGGPQRP